MTMDTVTVWVMEHDDPETEFVINSRSDMKGNFDDLLDESPNGLIEIRLPWRDDSFSVSLSTILEKVDPVTYEIEFGNYCQGWTEMEMPLDIFLSADDADREWVRRNL